MMALSTKYIIMDIWRLRASKLKNKKKRKYD